ncbi:Metallo-dependent phosphatase-like protein [Globomyces pollinis-pini]|nr:Metallo-dependent phosphatase-like protein [Globomyces pollinis-pini]
MKNFYSVFLLAQSLFAFPSTTVATDTYSFLVIGDWGAPAGQKNIVKAMNDIAVRDDAKFMMALGDNFYGTDELLIVLETGVSSTTDSKWKNVWKNVYTDRLQSIDWYSVLGNHDWYGNEQAQIDYSKVDKKWIMPDYFYTKVEKFGDKKVAILFIDTDLMNYGYTCTQGPECWLIDFSKAGWSKAKNTLETQFKWVEDQLIANKDADYLFVAGHHNVNLCGAKKDMPRLATLMEKYNVSAYFFGHQHSLGYTKKANTMYVLSGAAGKTENGCSGATWSSGNVFGFVNVKLEGQKFTVDFINQSGTILNSQVGSPRSLPK